MLRKLILNIAFFFKFKHQVYLAYLVSYTYFLCFQGHDEIIYNPFFYPLGFQSKLLFQNLFILG